MSNTEKSINHQTALYRSKYDSSYVDDSENCVKAFDEGYISGRRSVLGLSENVVCVFCGYNHCDLRDNEVPSDEFKCDNCGAVFEVIEETKTFYESREL